MHVLAGVCPWTKYPGPELPVGQPELAYEDSHPSPSPWTLVFDLLHLQEGLLDLALELKADLSSCVCYGGV